MTLTSGTARELSVDVPGERLDRFLARRLTGLTRGFCRDMIEQGRVRVDGTPRSADYRVRDGDFIRVHEARSAWPAFDLEAAVIVEDAAFLALRKPTGLLMHPLGETWLRRLEASITEPEPNLAGILFRGRPKIIEAGTPRCGIVHRLDRATSGVLLVAKTPAAYETLTRAFKEREVRKTYRAVVLGEPAGAKIDVDAPVGRLPGRRRMEVLPWGRPAQTEFKILESGRGVALVEARPRTGRTHQIRVHLAELGFPVLGDPEWIRGPELARLRTLKQPEPPRMMLHAYRLRFTHPKTGKPLSVTAPLPKDLRAYWRLLVGARL